MPNDTVISKLDTVEQNLRAALDEARQTYQQRGNRGSAVEDAVRDVLQQYTGQRIGHGEVIDSAGRTSAQTDVVIIGSNQPLTFPSNRPGLFFVEGVRAAGEVKAVLTGGNGDASLNRVLENSLRFKELEMRHSIADSGSMPIPYSRRSVPYLVCPPWFLLAFESKLSLATIHERVTTYAEAHNQQPFST